MSKILKSRIIRYGLTIVVLQMSALYGGRLVSAQESPVLMDIKKNNLIKVCIWPDYYGISYRNPRTNILQGIDIDLSKSFAKDLGVSVKYIDSSFSEFINDLNQNKCHIAMFGVGITESRSQLVQFSTPYLQSDIYLVTLKTNRSIQKWSDIDATNKIIAVQKDTFMEPALKKYLKKAEIIIAASPGERERLLESGRADAFATDFPYSRRSLSNYDWIKVINPDKPIALVNYAYAMKAGDPIFTNRVNQFVETIKKDGRLVNYAKKHGLSEIIK